MADEIKKAAEDVKKEAENTSKIMENMGKLFGDALTTGSKSFFSGLLKLNFKDFVKKTVDDLQKDSDFKADSKLLIDSIAGEAKKTASKILGDISGADSKSKIMDPLSKVFGDVVKTGSQSFLTGLLKFNLKDYFKNTIKDIKKDSDFKADSKLLTDALAGEVKEIAIKLWGGIKEAAKGLWGKIKEAFSGERAGALADILRVSKPELEGDASSRERFIQGNLKSILGNEKPSLSLGSGKFLDDIKISGPSKKTTQEAKTETPEETTKTLGRFQNVTLDSGAKKPSLGSGNYLAEYEGIINKTDKGTSKETIKRVEDNSAWGSLAKGFKDVSKTWNDVSQEMQKVGEGVATGMEKAFSSLFFDLIQGKFQGFKVYVKKFLDSIKEQVFKLIAEVLAKQATKALISFALSFFGGAAGGGAAGSPAGGTPIRAQGPAYHSGGYIPRFHAAGLASDERFAINKVGERYITKEQNEWLTGVARSMNNNQNMNVVVNVENKSSQPVKAKRGDTKFNGKEFVTNIILEDFTSNGPIVQAMKGV